MKIDDKSLYHFRQYCHSNWIERCNLVKSFAEVVKTCPSLRKRIDKVDKSFVRKITMYPGDITTHRISSVLRKIGVA